ncbi:ribonuclease H-like domain-containing protein, partial [Tanacetum coccineum]
MAKNETGARRYKTLAMVKLEQRSYASALSYLKKVRRNYNNLDALDNLEAVILIKKAYRKIILLVHPEKCLEFPHEATNATERLNDAYNTLLDADAKENAASRSSYTRSAPTIYASQPTTLLSAFSTMPLQDSIWHMDTGASSHLNFNASNLSTIFDKRLFPSVHVGDGESIPVTNTGHSIIPSHHHPLHLHNVLLTLSIIKNLISVHQFTRDNNCTIEFDAFGFSVKDYLTRHILLRCDSSSDLYPVTKPSTPIVFLSTSASTWHQRLRHPGEQVLCMVETGTSYMVSSGLQVLSWLINFIYVDDIILTASSPVLLHQIVDSLHREFDMTDLGALNYFLGISVVRYPIGLFLSRKKYARQLLERAHMVNCNPSRTPIDTDSKLVFSIMHDPREPHFAALKNVMRYVQGTLELGLQLYASATTSLVGYTDADWQVALTTRRSANPVSTPYRTKHIEIDIHFVRDMVKAGHVRVLHVPYRFQYADISSPKKARRNYNKLDALDNLEAVILVRSGEEQGRQDSLCGPWGDSQGYKSRDQEGVQKDHSSCPSGQMFGVSTCSN